MKTEPIQIPAVGRVPAFLLDPQNKAQVRALCARHRAYVTLSKSAWEARQTRTTPGRYRALERREAQMGENAEALLRPLGIVCAWPGLYPTFTVNGFAEHSVESAVLAALGHPRNWLTDSTALTEAEETARGVELVRVLELSEARDYDRKRYSPPRYATTHGTKTALGIFRTVAAIVEGAK